ncbi:MAG: DUF1772 domain-containing protein [Acidobacteria bacterium]|nr:DUF1772 domain-containing protein [Acidobacteriota bacterium]
MAISNEVFFALNFFAALGCGLIAGFFFAFSVGVMKALARLPPGEGIAAMQSINVAVLNPWFLGAFMGTAAICALVVIISLMRWRDPGAGYSLVGGMLYLLGSLIVTMLFNVPKNNELAAVTPADPASANLWASYLTNWTAWNHVRAVASLAAMVSLIIALCYQIAHVEFRSLIKAIN